MIRILFGTQFQDAIPVLWMLLPGTFMFNLLQILYSDLSGRGRPEIGIYAVFLSLVFTLTGNFLLIPLWGIMGAALVSSTAYIIGCLVILCGYLHVSGQTLRQLLYITREDFSALWQILWKTHKMHQL
jgi:O-antigen/teichoic acid export membrane protein